MRVVSYLFRSLGTVVWLSLSTTIMQDTLRHFLYKRLSGENVEEVSIRRGALPFKSESESTYPDHSTCSRIPYLHRRARTAHQSQGDSVVRGRNPHSDVVYLCDQRLRSDLVLLHQRGAIVEKIGASRPTSSPPCHLGMLNLLYMLRIPRFTRLYNN